MEKLDVSHLGAKGLKFIPTGLKFWYSTGYKKHWNQYFVDCCSEMGETSDELCSTNKWLTGLCLLCCPTKFDCTLNKKCILTHFFST